MDTKAILVRVSADLETARAELHVAEEKVARLEAMHDGLQLAMAEYEASSDAQDATSGEPDKLGETAEDVQKVAGQGLPGLTDRHVRNEVSHADLSLAALRAIGRPASTNEIRDRMVNAGYLRSREQVRGALSWLLKTGRVKRVAPGTWALAA